MKAVLEDRPEQISHNKRMQPDQNARYAFILTADAGR